MIDIAIQSLHYYSHHIARSPPHFLSLRVSTRPPARHISPQHCRRTHDKYGEDILYVRHCATVSEGCSFSYFHSSAYRHALRYTDEQPGCRYQKCKYSAHHIVEIPLIELVFHPSSTLPATITSLHLSRQIAADYG
jgi:hypothetical protein